MNDNHSQRELFYRPRWLAGLLRETYQESRVTVLTGARQVGKTTLLKNEEPFSSWTYLTLDDLTLLEQAETNPASLWSNKRDVVIDEVQRSPKLLSAIKLDVDQNPGQRRFVLTGSANLLLMQKVSESLAGRAYYYQLDPVTLGEERLTSPPAVFRRLFKGALPEEGRVQSEDPVPLMLRGFMPRLMDLTEPPEYARFWNGYVTTYLERDLRQLSQIESLPDFRRLMEALALRSGQVVNQTEVARDLKISQPTVHRYINLLETSYLIKRIPAFMKNRTARLIKSPKLYWLDPGLAVFLAGYGDIEDLRSARELGCFFECLVLLHLQAVAELMTPRPRFYYRRTTTGREVDFVIEQGRKVVACEVKLTSDPNFGDVRILSEFLNMHSEAAAGILIHGGNEIKHLGERIVAVPWTVLAGM